MHLLIPRPKWFKDSDVKIGDIVLFFIEENKFHTLTQFWKYGKIITVSGTRLTIEYTTQNSFTKKSIVRNKRDVVKISSEDDLDFNSHSHKEKMIDKILN